MFFLRSHELNGFQCHFGVGDLNGRIIPLQNDFVCHTVITGDEDICEFWFLNLRIGSFRDRVIDTADHIRLFPVHQIFREQLHRFSGSFPLTICMPDFDFPEQFKIEIPDRRFETAEPFGICCICFIRDILRCQQDF